MSDPREPLTPLTEQELMQRLANGDETAIRTIYRRFARSVFGVGHRMLGSPEAAEELTQDVFLTAWRKAARFDPARGRLSTWLMAIAHNMAVDRLRRTAARIPETLGGFEEPPEIGESGEEAVLDREEAQRVLSALTARERRLVEMAYFRGWTAREIAEADGIPLGTVKTRLRTILIKLRSIHVKWEV
ncbi:MAG: RNA polymerase sigma factor [Actinomycetota bacterium]